MIRRPPRSTRTDTLFPYTTLFRSACAVAVRGLRMLGARRVSHAVPNRMVHGYGLSPALVDELAPLQPDLLVTVDHGIACSAGIAAAKAHGWPVLVTDQHQIGRAHVCTQVTTAHLVSRSRLEK